MTWFETLKLAFIALAELAKPLALYLKLRNARLLWDERKKYDEDYEESASKIEELRRNNRGLDADRLRDEFESRRVFLDSVSADLSLPPKGSSSAND